MAVVGGIKVCNCTLPYEDCCGKQYKYYQPLPHRAVCDHCFCQEVTIGMRPHVQCCNCGHTKLSPFQYIKWDVGTNTTTSLLPDSTYTIFY